MSLRTAMVLFGTLVASQERLESVLTKMDRAAMNFKNLSASIRKVSHTAVINEDSVDTGTILLKRVKQRDIRMLIELREPDRKMVAFQGRKLEIYFPKIQTVQEYDLGKNRELLDQFLLLGFGTPARELTSAYQIHLLGWENVGGQKRARLELIPKSKDVLQHLKKVELWISDATGYPVQQKFYLPAGDYMLATYSDTKINTDMPDSELKLKLPKGVKREYPQK